VPVEDVLPTDAMAASLGASSDIPAVRPRHRWIRICVGSACGDAFGEGGPIRWGQGRSRSARSGLTPAAHGARTPRPSAAW